VKLRPWRVRIERWASVLLTLAHSDRRICREAPRSHTMVYLPCWSHHAAAWVCGHTPHERTATDQLPQRRRHVVCAQG